MEADKCAAEVVLDDAEVDQEGAAVDEDGMEVDQDDAAAEKCLKSVDTEARRAAAKTSGTGRSW